MNPSPVVQIVETRDVIEDDLLISKRWPYNVRTVYRQRLRLKKDDVVHLEGQVAVKTPSGRPDTPDYFNAWLNIRVCNGQYAKKPPPTRVA